MPSIELELELCWEHFFSTHDEYTLPYLIFFPVLLLLLSSFSHPFFEYLSHSYLSNGSFFLYFPYAIFTFCLFFINFFLRFCTHHKERSLVFMEDLFLAQILPSIQLYFLFHLSLALKISIKEF